jgi:hypothetical protein
VAEQIAAKEDLLREPCLREESRHQPAPPRCQGEPRARQHGKDREHQEQQTEGRRGEHSRDRRAAEAERAGRVAEWPSKEQHPYRERRRDHELPTTSPPGPGRYPAPSPRGRRAPTRGGGPASGAVRDSTPSP